MKSAFVGTSAFNRTLCTTAWLEVDGKRKGDFLKSRGWIFCCDSGSHYNPTISDPFKTDFQCSDCLPGRFNEQKTTATACSSCPSGWYQSKPGKAFCFPCLRGTFAEKTGSSNCTKCAEGKISQISAAENSNTCESCVTREAETGAQTTVPNEEQNACVAPYAGWKVKTSLGANLDPRENEGEPFSYQVLLSADPTPYYKSEAGVVVEVTTSDPERCAISISKEKDGGSSSATSSPSSSSSSSSSSAMIPLTFTAKNYNVGQAIHVHSIREEQYPRIKKKEVVYTCDLIHETRKSKQDQKLHYSPVTLSLHVLSHGCGVGEYLGEDLAAKRGVSGKDCLCQQDYFLGVNWDIKEDDHDKGDCQRCPTPQSHCPLVGMRAPRARPGWWREDPSSPDLKKQKFYKCGGREDEEEGEEKEEEIEEEDKELQNEEREKDGGDGEGGKEGKEGKEKEEGDEKKDDTFETNQAKKFARYNGRCFERTNTTSTNVTSIFQCQKGFNESSPLCSICMTGYIMSHDKCTKCDGRESEDGQNVTSTLSGFIIIGCVCYLLVVGICMSQRAIGYKEWTRIDVLIKAHERKERQEKEERERRENAENNKATQALETLQASNLKYFLASNRIHLSAIEMEIVCRAFTERQQDQAILGDLVVGIGESYVHPSKSKTQGTVKTKHVATSSRMARLALVKKKQKQKQKQQLGSTTTNPLEEVDLDHHVSGSISGSTKDDLDERIESDEDKDNDSESQTHQQTHAEKAEHVLHDTGAAHYTHVQHVASEIKVVKEYSTKLKLLLGFSQIFSFIPDGWPNIPWPTGFQKIAAAMKIFSFDLFSPFDSISCHFQSGFYAKFTFAMLLLPTVFLLTVISFIVVIRIYDPRRGDTKKNKKKSADNEGAISHTFTYEAARNRLNMILFLVVHLGYTFVANNVILLFKCVHIQDKYYLASDFHIVCYDETWWQYNFWAWFGIIIYVIGIPCAMLGVLLWHRKYLYAEECGIDEMDNHVLINRSYGSIYIAACPHSFYFEILDLVRRLLLTNGLFVQGHVTQIVLGALVCTCWTMFVVKRQPLRSESNNSLAASLSFLTVLTMLGGMALELQQYEEASLGGGGGSAATEGNNGTASEKSESGGTDEISFVILMGMFGTVIVGLALSSLVKLVPCLGRLLTKLWMSSSSCCCCSCFLCRRDDVDVVTTDAQELEMTENVIM